MKEIANPYKKSPYYEIIKKILLLTCGLFWTLTYILMIKIGFTDKTYAMPIIALGANLSWEFIFSFIYPQIKPQVWVNKIWFIFDLVILYQFIIFGLPIFFPTLPSWISFTFFILILIICYLSVLKTSKLLNDTQHGKYAAFGQNLLMSILFINFIFMRPDLSGQAIYIGIFKMLGTVCSSIAFYRGIPNNKTLNLMYIGIFIFDILYLVLFYYFALKLGINPWLKL